MANLKVKPEYKKLPAIFTIQSQVVNLLKTTAVNLDVSMSQFVEEAILEKIERLSK